MPSPSPQQRLSPFSSNCSLHRPSTPFTPQEYHFATPPKHDPQQAQLPQQQMTTEEMEVEAAEMIGWVIDNNSLTLMKLIGTGSFAVVFLAQEQFNPNIRYAVKCLFKRGLDPLQLALQRQEAQMLASLRHCPNVVHLYNVIETSQHLFLVLEFCELDLYDAITQQGGFPEDVVKEVFSQLCDAIIACHENSIYHRDLKPENVLISIDFRIKLADFGLACHDEWSREFGCGSVRYMAPECLSDPSTLSYQSRALGYSTVANDCWSLGVILINLLFGKNPWHQASPSDPIFGQYVGKNPNILRQQFNLSKEFDAILHQVFNIERKQRCSVQQLKMMVEQCQSFVEVRKLKSDETFQETTEETYIVPNESIDQSQFSEWSVHEVKEVPPTPSVPESLTSEDIEHMHLEQNSSVISRQSSEVPNIEISISKSLPSTPADMVVPDSQILPLPIETNGNGYPISVQSSGSKTEIVMTEDGRMLGTKNSFWSETTAVGDDEKWKCSLERRDTIDLNKIDESNDVQWNTDDPGDDGVPHDGPLLYDFEDVSIHAETKQVQTEFDIDEIEEVVEHPISPPQLQNPILADSSVPTRDSLVVTSLPATPVLSPPPTPPKDAHIRSLSSIETTRVPAPSTTSSSTSRASPKRFKHRIQRIIPFQSPGRKKNNAKRPLKFKLKPSLATDSPPSKKSPNCSRSMFSMMATVLRIWGSKPAAKKKSTDTCTPTSREYPTRSLVQSPRASSETIDVPCETVFTNMNESKEVTDDLKKKKRGASLFSGKIGIVGLGMPGIMTNWMYGFVGAAHRKKSV